MIEVVFSDSACGNLKAARRTWKSTILPDDKDCDVYCFNLTLSVGDISDNGIGTQRKNALRKMLSAYGMIDMEGQIEEELTKAEFSLSSVMKRYIGGEEIRIWYSDNPDELCGMCWLMKQIQPLNCRTAVYLVKLPAWEYEKDGAVIARQAWGEIDPCEWERYAAIQEKVSSAFISACATQWKQLQIENAPLRVMLNGRLQSVPEDIYDSFILREIASQPEQFDAAVVIGNILGKYQLGIGDVWIYNRIDVMIRDGRLEVVLTDQTEVPYYRRILRKRM